uniref:NADH dehydrogenase subunit 6 n=1 Tax=Lanceolaria lanceolata TaxID=2508263 RepID=A0A1W5HZC5_LANLA|nr:NADH dehydrogenase subunit 6 [Lanceolaria lanceolata]
MTLMLFTSMMIFYLLNTVTSSHPLVLTIKVLWLAFSVCLAVSFSMTWYAYMIFMVMLGGMLVMFTYISSFAPNSIFKTKLNVFYLVMQMMITLTLTHNLIVFFPKPFNTQKPILIPENFITFFLSSENSSLLLTMTSALLLSMYIVSTLLSNSKTAMRPTKYTLLSSQT